jgi:hypothetical protein
LRQKVGKKSQLQQSRRQQQPRREQRYHLRQLDILRACDRRHPGQSASEDRGSGGIGSHHQVSGRTEDRKCKQWQQQGIEPGHNRCTGDFGITKRLRDIHRRKLASGQNVAQRSASIQGPYTGEQLKTGHDGIGFWPFVWRANEGAVGRDLCVAPAVLVLCTKWTFSMLIPQATASLFGEWNSAIQAGSRFVAG